MRRLRRSIEMGLPVAGVIVVLAGVLFFAGSLYAQLGVVLLGLLLIEAGIWKLASPVLPSERRYNALRAEVDGFILLVRRLNRATLENTSDPTPANRARLLLIRDEMMESVRRMEAVAGRTEEEQVASSQPRPTGAPASGTQGAVGERP